MQTCCCSRANVGDFFSRQMISIFFLFFDKRQSNEIENQLLLLLCNMHFSYIYVQFFSMLKTIQRKISPI